MERTPVVHTVRLQNGNLINGVFDANGDFCTGHQMKRVKNNLEFLVKKMREISAMREFIQNIRIPRHSLQGRAE